MLLILPDELTKLPAYLRGWSRSETATACFMDSVRGRVAHCSECACRARVLGLRRFCALQARLTGAGTSPSLPINVAVDSLAAELTDAIGKFRGAGRPCDPGPVGGLQSKLSLDGSMADELTVALSPGTPR